MLSYLIVLSALSGSPVETPSRASRPNVLLITSDDHGRRDLGCYGNPSIRTPTLDGLAAAGLTFENCQTVTAISCPSRAALMTGMYPFTNGCFGMKACKEDIVPLTQYLADAGYFCGLVGKRMLAPWDAYRFEYAPPDPKQQKRGRDNSAYRDDVEGFFARLRGEAQDRAFFLMVNFHDPHRRFPEEGLLPRTVDRSRIDVPPDLADVPDVREELARYYATIERLDRGVGEVLACLTDAGYAGGTMVVYVGDHGPAFPFAKSTLYEAGLSVPCVMGWPGHIEPGSSSDALISFVDMAPTILELVGLPMPPDMEGESFAPLLRDHANEHRASLFGSHTDDDTEPSYPMRSVRHGGLKYIFNFERVRTRVAPSAVSGLTWRAMVLHGRKDPAVYSRVHFYLRPPQEELYDLVQDPCELNNLAEAPAYKPQFLELRRLLAKHMSEVGDPFRAVYPFGDVDDRSRMEPAYEDYLRYTAARIETVRNRRLDASSADE